MSNGENTPNAVADNLYVSNLRLNRAEFANRRLHLESMPLYLSVVLGTACNIDCPYCYQTRTNEMLFPPGPLGEDLRRELSAFYPYLSTLRIGGGEVFLIRGFEELIDEVASAVDRPLVSISTNGTLIDRRWAEKIVGMPFQEVTISIDGAVPETYARLRRGAVLENVLRNLDRLQQLKEQRNSRLPDINFFSLVMRSNFREIPHLLRVAEDHGIEQVSFQTPVIDKRNLSRDPALAAEVDFSDEEIRELHDLVGLAIQQSGHAFRSINVSGLHGLFQSHNLPVHFLQEDRFSIYPGSSPAVAGSTRVEPGTPQDVGAVGLTTDEKDRESGNENVRATDARHGTACDDIELCPNPWTLMYVAQTGDVHLCFATPPIGNIYETSLIRLWNSPKAIASRSDLINGRYGSAGCSKQWCSWREGKRSKAPAKVETRELVKQFRTLTLRALEPPSKPAAEPALAGPSLDNVRRLLTERSARIAELEGNFVGLCEKNREMLETADRQHQALAGRARELGINVDLASAEPLAPPRAVRFGSGAASRRLKKAAIGAAVRAILLLERLIRLLKKFVTWVSRSVPGN